MTVDIIRQKSGSYCGCCGTNTDASGNLRCGCDEHCECREQIERLKQDNAALRKLAEDRLAALETVTKAAAEQRRALEELRRAYDRVARSMGYLK